MNIAAKVRLTPKKPALLGFNASLTRRANVGRLDPGLERASIYLTHQVLLTKPQALNSESPRSGRQRKAWGASPRIAIGKAIKAREAGGS
jgi:hypothetical protein